MAIYLYSLDYIATFAISLLSRISLNVIDDDFEGLIIVLYN